MRKLIYIAALVLCLIGIVLVPTMNADRPVFIRQLNFEDAFHMGTNGEGKFQLIAPNSYVFRATSEGSAEFFEIYVESLNVTDSGSAASWFVFNDLTVNGPTECRGTTMLQSNVTMSTNCSLVIASGPKQRAGIATLVGGTVTVNNSSVTANTKVMAWFQTTTGTTAGILNYTLVAGTSFTVNSVSATGTLVATDTSVINYLLIENP